MTTTTIGQPYSPAVERRMKIERKIARRVIKLALEAGYTLSLNDGEEMVVKDSTSARDVLNAMFSVDEEHLHLRCPAHNGWVFFVYGNDGYDVINDHTTNLDPIMDQVAAYAEELERGG